LIAVLVFMTPVFVALYVLTIPDGAWRLVVAIQILATVIVTIASTLFFLAGVWVSPEGLRERGYFGRVSYVPVQDMASIILAETFTGVSTEATLQLFVCDPRGKQLVRLRGQFWSKESMDVVVATLNVPLKTLDNTLSHKELQTEYPGLLYWFERRPVLAAFAFTAAIAAFGGIVLLILGWLGVSA